MKNYSIIKTIFFIAFLGTFNYLSAQVEGTTILTEETTEAYNLFNAYDDNFNQHTYLVNNCGEVINTWDASKYYHQTKLLPNGNILYKDENTVYEQDWDGNIVNEVSHNDSDLELRYDVIILPSGNYLSVGRRNFSEQEFLDIGYDIPYTDPWLVDVVVEMDRNTGEIVWEWNIIDHVIQERDPNLANYGSIFDNPQLLNMDAIGTIDWSWEESFMINSMEYNSELDQIILSVRKMSEIVIIDHTTTTEEAAGSTGGIYGKGGDILYRWGNPQNYGRGTEEDRTLYFQHNPNWIKYGEHQGKIICFNNGLGRPDVEWDENYSTVPIISPPIDENGHYILEENAAFEPAIAEVEYSKVHTGTDFYSDYTSGATILPNGHIAITLGELDRLIELNPAGEIIWDYQVPSSSFLYRSDRYASDYSGFDGQDLTPTGELVSGDNSTHECHPIDTMTTSTNQLILAESTFTLAQLRDAKQIQINNTAGNQFDIELFSIQGYAIAQLLSTNAQHQLSVDRLTSGVYVIRLIDKKTNHWASHKIVIQ